MKVAYKPQKFRLNIPKPRLFAASNRGIAVVDEENNVIFILFYL